MRSFAKGAEPQTVTDVRCAPTTNISTPAAARAAFDQIDKAAVRRQLEAEQGALCAFCMRRIDKDSRDDAGFIMKIAHRIPVAADPSLALAWNNLLGSCDGGQRSPGRGRTCDLAQEDRPIAVDPTDQNSVARLAFERRDLAEGYFLTSMDPTLRGDIVETLNLNGTDLPALRESRLRAFQTLLRDAHPRSHWEVSTRRAFFEKWRASFGANSPSCSGSSRLGCGAECAAADGPIAPWLWARWILGDAGASSNCTRRRLTPRADPRTETAEIPQRHC